MAELKKEILPKTELVLISKIKSNPNNPRIIKDDKFKKLVESVINFPEMLNVRPIVVNSEMVILGGNMRFKACQEAGYKKIPIIKADNLTEEQQCEFIIKDNVSGGEWDWDVLTNDWDSNLLEEWGLDVPIFDDEEQKDLSGNFKTEFKIEVVCTDESNQEKIYNKLIELGLECRILTL